MVPYFLTLLCVLVAGIIHWTFPKTFWKSTAMSTAIILLVSLAALFIFKASGLLMSEETGKTPDFSGNLLMITVLISFFGLLISIFVGWFLRVIRN